MDQILVENGLLEGVRSEDRFGANFGTKFGPKTDPEWDPKRGPEGAPEGPKRGPEFGPENGPEKVPKWTPRGAPKWTPKRSKLGPWSDPRSIQRRGRVAWSALGLPELPGAPQNRGGSR